MNRWTSLVVAGLLFIVGAACVEPVSAAGNESGPGTWQQLLARVASILGITEQRLTDAVKQASQELVDEAARAGRLTQEQAQRLKVRIAQGQLPFGHRFEGGRPEARPGLALGGSLKAAAGFLGLTPQQLMEELRAGKTLAQVAEAHGKTRAQLKDALLAQVKEAIEKAVTSGKATREQADARLREAGGRIDGLLDRTMPAGRLKGPWGRPFGPRHAPPAPGS